MPSVLAALSHRKSIRAFLDQPVDRDMIKQILEAAHRAPSQKNAQPWRVVVLTGASKQTLSQKIIEVFRAGVAPQREHEYFSTSSADFYKRSERAANKPDHFDQQSIYKQRARACGYALYQSIGVNYADEEGRKRNWERNYDFFGAPVGLIIYTDAFLDKLAWLDVGAFLQSIAVGAQEFGLGVCAQASFGDYPAIVRQHLNLTDKDSIVSGMAIGFPDMTHSINQYRTERASLPEFVRWEGDNG